MRQQQQIWQNEHDEAKQLPSEMKKSSTVKPSGYVEQFADFLKQNSIVPPAKAIDIGAGKGRNAIYLAKLGFAVTAIDYIKSAIDHIQNIAEELDLRKSVHGICTPADAPWPFPDNYFDVAVDCFASIDIETKQGREIYRGELLRTLKQGGYALVVVVSTEDEIESELLRESPGQEKNSTTWPQSGKFQKDYDEPELREFYSNFEILELRKIQKPAHKLGRDFIATNFVLILRKKNN